MRTVTICAAVLLAASLGACATQQQASADSRSSAEQAKQKELQQMEQQGQRNDFDKIRIN